MSDETKEHWSEWFDWTIVDIYETMYHEVPGNNWCEVDIEFEHKDGSISKAYMCPYEEWTDDDYWKTYELQGTDDNKTWDFYIWDKVLPVIVSYQCPLRSAYLTIDEANEAFDKITDYYREELKEKTIRTLREVYI